MSNEPLKDEQLAALYGPSARFSEHKRGETIRFRDVESDKELTGVILWVAAPGQAIEGGREHPVRYIVDSGRGFPDIVYPADIREEGV